jgi:G3E family GTPase
VTSQSFQYNTLTQGWFDMPSFQVWLNTLLKTHGENLFRCKGVMAFQGMEKPIIFQGVHMLLDMVQAEEPWSENTTPAWSQLVFIGRNLEAMNLQAGLEACLRPQVAPIIPAMPASSVVS